MKKVFLLIILMSHLTFSTRVLAAQTDSQYFTATCGLFKLVNKHNGTMSAEINPNTGVLNSSLNSSFSIITNSRYEQNLTMSATANTENGTTNAIFNISDAKYIILTNSSKKPSIGTIEDIKNGSSNSANNPNAIAYSITDPTETGEALKVKYNAEYKDWELQLTKRGVTQTSITIPSGNPLENTYSVNDLAGSYQATIMLSFD